MNPSNTSRAVEYLHTAAQMLHTATDPNDMVHDARQAIEGSRGT